MKPRERRIQTLTVRSLGGSVVWGRRPTRSVLPSAPLGVSPAPRRPGKTTLTPALLLKCVRPGQTLPLESP